MVLDRFLIVNTLVEIVYVQVNQPSLLPRFHCMQSVDSGFIALAVICKPVTLTTANILASLFGMVPLAYIILHIETLKSYDCQIMGRFYISIESIQYSYYDST